MYQHYVSLPFDVIYAIDFEFYGDASSMVTMVKTLR